MMTTSAKDVKGKGRATENTPLLSGEGSSSYVERLATDPEQQQTSTEHDPHSPHHSLRHTLINVFLGSLTIVVVLFVIFILLFYSYARRVRGAESDQLAKAIIWQGPRSINVLDMKEGGEVVVDIQGLIGVDTNAVLGFNPEDDDTDNLFTALWKDIGRWGVGVLKHVTVEIGEVVTFERHGRDPLAWASAEPFTLRLTADPGERWDPSWLQPIKLRVTAKPSQDAGLLQRFAQGAWERGIVDLRMEIDRMYVRGGSIKSGGWRKMVEAKRENVTTAFQYLSECRYRTNCLITNRISIVPPIPGLPEPRPPLIKMLQLVSYSLVQEDGRLALYALATIPSPLKSVKFSLPKVPYEVSLLAPPLQPVPISTGIVAPVLTPPNISIPITGHIVPLSSPDSSLVLSQFLSNFLSGVPPPIALHTPLLPNITIETVFSPPVPPPKVLRNVTIKHMSMSVAPGGGMLASGMVWATVALPPGLHTPVNATHVWPDVLVYDGPVHGPEAEPIVDHQGSPLHLPDIHLPHPKIPKIPIPEPRIPKLPNPWDRNFPFPKHPDPSDPSHHHHDDDPPPLPSPLPDRAFARIRPTDWVVATTLGPCEDDEGDGERVSGILDGDGWIFPGRKRKPDCSDVKLGEDAGWTAVVTANVDKVPLQVLPGRDRQFRSFLSKVLWSKGGALAGIKGVAGVRAKVEGLLEDGNGSDGERSLELHDLPFEGTVVVGKRNL